MSPVTAASLTSLPLGLWNYWLVVVLMMLGLYIVMARTNLVKKVMGLNIFQVSVIMFYVSIGKVQGGTAPILTEGDPSEPSSAVYSNPLPHVLMLTAIVVGVATMSLALSLVVRIREEYGTVEEDEILAKDQSPQ
ncbi:MAG: cation:proton antiporter subunit C [Proteobacteria bacterium]|nr:cation:proton antiporter subunit C [Pseudomonadota bacterium]